MSNFRSSSVCQDLLPQRCPSLSRSSLAWPRSEQDQPDWLRVICCPWVKHFDSRVDNSLPISPSAIQFIYLPTIAELTPCSLSDLYILFSFGFWSNIISSRHVERIWTWWQHCFYLPSVRVLWRECQTQDNSRKNLLKSSDSFCSRDFLDNICCIPKKVTKSSMWTISVLLQLDIINQSFSICLFKICIVLFPADAVFLLTLS